MDTSQTTTSGNGSDKASATVQAVKDKFSQMTRTTRRSAEALRGDLSDMKGDLDSLVDRASTMSEDELNEAYAQLMLRFSSLRNAAKGIASQAGRQLNRGMDTTTDYVKDKPMQSLAVAIGAGVLLGLLFKRR